MIKRADAKAARLKRHQRIRGKISGTPERPRLSVYRSEKNIYAQIIDDVAGKTLVSASTVEKGFEGKKPRTTCRVTGIGRQAFAAYVDALKEYLNI